VSDNYTGNLPSSQIKRGGGSSLNPEEKSKPKSANPLTRREWILRLGETVALTGFSGVVADPSLSVPEPQSRPPKAAGLPPGLYDPSNDHMSHALVSDQRFLPIPPGSETEYAIPYASPFVPRFFSKAEFPVVLRLVELFLNAGLTGTPEGTVDRASLETVTEIAEWIDLEVSEASAVRGAANNLSAQHWQLNVLFFSEAAMRELRDGQPDHVWRSGLEWINQEATRQNSRDFLSLLEPAQLAMLNLMGEEKTPSGHGLFQLLKNQVVRGFYTSQAGLRELDYKGNAFYPRSPGCEG
jgi:Gluconate 2-dehydrogenase subunit 3